MTNWIELQIKLDRSN